MENFSEVLTTPSLKYGTIFINLIKVQGCYSPRVECILVSQGCVEAKLWISFKSSSKANITLVLILLIFALDLDFKEIHSFAPRFSPGCIPTEESSIRGP